VLQIAQVMVARDNDFRPRPDSTSEDGVVGWVVANDRSDFCGLDEMRQRGVTEEQLARGDFGFEQTTGEGWTAQDILQFGKQRRAGEQIELAEMCGAQNLSRIALPKQAR
jgi:hypothetical protein